MKKLLFGAILIPATLFLTACGPHGANISNLFGQSTEPTYNSENDCGFVQNIYGERISWKNNLPVRIALHESIPPQFHSAIQAAMRDWEKAVGRPLFQITEFGLKGPATPRQDGVSVIYWMNTWDNNVSEQARTSVYWIGDEIREADIRINARDFSFYVDDPQGRREVHMESLLLHELGHVLGLKHNDADGSVMAVYLSALTERTQIEKTNVDSIRCEY